jgi:hypothetical protein
MTEYAFPTTKAPTQTCFHCRKKGFVTVSTEAYEKWQAGLGPIQAFMPELHESLREQLISGTHPECWNALFPPDEDDD